VRDGVLRRGLKRVALWNFQANLGVHRLGRRLRGERPFALGGDCRRCARCCEAPALQALPLVFHRRLLRRLWLSWQEQVNGFVLVRTEAATRTFVFRCTHFDVATRTCDSYDSRPGVCRDYPRLLLWQPNPELLPGCGYRAVPVNAAALRARLDAEPLTPEQREKLRRGLFLE
jgi:Fe-S-cluster containining protein